MPHFKYHRFIQILSTICFFIIAFQYWGIHYLSFLFMLIPYLIIFLLAKPELIKSKVRAVARTIGCVLISIISLGLMFGIEADPQAGIGIVWAVGIQYCVIFASEVIIGLTVEPDD